MPRYYFHLRAGDAYIPDRVGADIENADETARHLMRILGQAGAGNHQGWSFDIADESGELIDTMPLEGLLGAVH